MESSSNETKSKESYISSQGTLTNFKEVQSQMISFDNYLKTM